MALVVKISFRGCLGGDQGGNSSDTNPTDLKCKVHMIKEHSGACEAVVVLLTERCTLHSRLLSAVA